MYYIKALSSANDDGVQRVRVLSMRCRAIFLSCHLSVVPHFPGNTMPLMTRRTFASVSAMTVASGLVSQLDAQDEGTLQSRLLADVAIEIEAPRDAGAGRGGRLVVQVARGTIIGPRLRGSILAPSGDWIVERSDKSRILDVRLLVQTDDGELIYMSWRGVAYTAPNGSLFARTTPVFETGAPKYTWLNNVVSVGVYRPTPGKIAYRIYEVL
jgi:hypothetical protein